MKIFSPKIQVIGIGGGGSTIVSELAEKVYGLRFVAANTDRQALDQVIGKARMFCFGESITNGLGAGMDAEVGKAAAKSSKREIESMLSQSHLCIFIGCLGGGVGSGASAVFIQIAKGLKIPTLGIFTLPFAFEGERRKQVAQEGLREIRTSIDGLMIVENEGVFQLIKRNTPLQNALSTINRMIIENLNGLSEMLLLKGLINIDFADVQFVLRGQGKLCYFKSFEIPVDSASDEFDKQLLEHPLCSYDSSKAERLVFNIMCGENFSFHQVNSLSEMIRGAVSPGARISFGILQDEKYRDRVKVTFLANGCEGKSKGKNSVYGALRSIGKSSNPKSSYEELLSLRSEENPEEKIESDIKIEKLNL